MEKVVVDIGRDDGEHVVYEVNVDMLTGECGGEGVCVIYVDDTGTHMTAHGDPKRLLMGMVKATKRIAKDIPGCFFKVYGGYGDDEDGDCRDS